MPNQIVFQFQLFIKIRRAPSSESKLEIEQINRATAEGRFFICKRTYT